MGKNKQIRETDANPEVVSADVLEPTQDEIKEELSKHSDFEKETGVKEEELDTRPVVDTGVDTTFAERTSAKAPWAEYQEEAEKKEAKRAKQIQADLTSEKKD